jgi:hypothetical protein
MIPRDTPSGWEVLAACIVKRSPHDSIDCFADLPTAKSRGHQMWHTHVKRIGRVSLGTVEDLHEALVVGPLSIWCLFDPSKRGRDSVETHLEN